MSLRDQYKQSEDGCADMHYIISHITRVLLCAHSRFLLWWMNIAIDHMGEDGRRGRGGNIWKERWEHVIHFI